MLTKESWEYALTLAIEGKNPPNDEDNFVAAFIKSQVNEPKAECGFDISKYKQFLMKKLAERKIEEYKINACESIGLIYLKIKEINFTDLEKEFFKLKRNSILRLRKTILMTVAEKEWYRLYTQDMDYISHLKLTDEERFQAANDKFLGR